MSDETYTPPTDMSREDEAWVESRHTAILMRMLQAADTKTVLGLLATGPRTTTFAKVIKRLLAMPNPPREVADLVTFAVFLADELWADEVEEQLARDYEEYTRAKQA